MNLPAQIATHLRDVHFGGNWTASNLKDVLNDVTWEEATARVPSFHPMATLVYHMNYFVSAVLNVLEGGPLDAKDKFSFDVPPIRNAEDWEALLAKTWSDAERLASRIEKLPEEVLWKTFVNEEYGNYYRNLHGIIEHNHYHLGQVALIKKALKRADADKPDSRAPK